MPENYSMAAIYHNCPALGQINGWDWPQSSIWPITSTPSLPKSNALALIEASILIQQRMMMMM
jgi:hypothetical protein